MSIPYKPVTDMAVYEKIANECTDTVEGFLNLMHVGIAAEIQTTDAGPLIQGFIGGLIAWALASGDTDVDAFRADLLRIYDCIAPQIAMSMAAEAAGTFTEGTA